MPLTAQDRIDIHDLIARHGHLTDDGRLDEADELFTPDVAIDLDDVGLGTLHGTAALREVTLALGDGHPVGHHVTDVVVSAVDEHSARVRSKGIGVMADGTAGSVVYDDVVARRPDGWRIAHRTVTARRTALAAGPREVLRRWRQASIDRSADDMRRVYAPDAVHEFPFTRPGVPSRLEGRDTIVDWMAAFWAGNAPRFERYRTLSVRGTDDPSTIVVEQEALGTSATTGEFALPNLVVLTTRGGQVAHLRDYANVLAVAAVMGHDPELGSPTAHR